MMSMPEKKNDEQGRKATSRVSGIGFEPDGDIGVADIFADPIDPNPGTPDERLLSEPSHDARKTDNPEERAYEAMATRRADRYAFYNADSRIDPIVLFVPFFTMAGTVGGALLGYSVDKAQGAWCGAKCGAIAGAIVGGVLGVYLKWRADNPDELF